MEHRAENSLSNPFNKEITWDDFLKKEQDSDNYFEYDGKTITALANPSRQHQRLSVRISSMIDNVLNGSKCEVITAPFSLMYDYEYKGGPAKQCIPDILVRCYKENENEDIYPGNKYYGVPFIVIEIISPTNFSDDYNKKKLIYESLGVLEYIIVNMYTREVLVYTYDNETKKYDVGVTFKDGDIFTSTIFETIKIDISELLSDVQVSEEDVKYIKQFSIFSRR